MNEGLSSFRKKKHLTQKEFSKKIGITLSYYSKIELGVRSPSYNFLTKFTNVFPEASVKDIFFKNI